MSTPRVSQVRKCFVLGSGPAPMPHVKEVGALYLECQRTPCVMATDLVDVVDCTCQLPFREASPHRLCL